MAITLRSGSSPTNLARIDADGALLTATRGAMFAPVSTTVAAAATGALGPVDVSAAGVVSFIVKNTTAASAWSGSPVIVFEQSDDQVSWTPLVCVRSDTSQALPVHVLGAGAANQSIVFDAALEGVAWVRARVTTGPSAGSLTVVAQPGGMAFAPSLVVQQPARTAVVLSGTALAVGATGVETLLTVTQQRGTAAAVSAASYTVPAGRRLRVQSLVFTQVGSGTAAAATSIFRLRYNPAGAVAVNSTPVLLPARLASPTTATSFQQLQVSPADGYEIAGDGVASFGFTVQATYVTNAPTVDVLLVGYEF